MGDGERVSVDGHTFWRAVRAGHATELTTETGIELDAQRCRWTVTVPGTTHGEPVESRSPDVRFFLSNVLHQMHRAMRQATVRPVPKPAPKPDAPLPATAPVPCPLCRGETPPSGGGGHGGEPWPDCEVCDGAGVVTQRQAEEWHELRPH